MKIRQQPLKKITIKQEKEPECIFPLTILQEKIPSIKNLKSLDVCLNFGDKDEFAKFFDILLQYQQLESLRLELFFWNCPDDDINHVFASMWKFLNMPTKLNTLEIIFSGHCHGNHNDAFTEYTVKNNKKFNKELKNLWYEVSQPLVFKNLDPDDHRYICCKFIENLQKSNIDNLHLCFDEIVDESIPLLETFFRKMPHTRICINDSDIVNDLNNLNLKNVFLSKPKQQLVYNTPPIFKISYEENS